MSLNDPLSNAISHILNCEKMHKEKCIISKSSKLIKEVLLILKENKYISDFKSIPSLRGESLEVNLNGNINKCGVIKPRFSLKIGEYEKFEKRYLPAKDFGIIIISTPKGLMVHNKAMENKTGGKLIAYCY
jgi:small subunit ribosomal protein S8